jgi:hypothetical protein
LVSFDGSNQKFHKNNFISNYLDQNSFHLNSEKHGLTNRAGANCFYMKSTSFSHIFLLLGLQLRILDYAIEDISPNLF